MNLELDALVAALTSYADENVNQVSNESHFAELVEAICIRLKVPAGPSGPKLENFDVLNRCARAVAKTSNPQPVSRCVELLIEAVGAQCNGGDISDALELSRRAMELAQTAPHLPLLRRALTHHALAHAVDGRFQVAVAFCLQAAKIAQDLGDLHGVVAALVNVVGYCNSAGAHQEVLSISPRLRTADYPESRRWSLAAIVNVNAAGSALALRKYSLSASYAKAVCEDRDVPDGINEMWRRMIAEFCWLRSAIGLGNRIVARERMHAINSISPEFHTTRTTLLRELATCSYESFIGNDDVAIARLERLLGRTRAIASLHGDNLELLTEAYQRAGDHASALRYLAMRLDARSQGQIELIGKSLRRVRQQGVTGSVGNADAAALIDAIRLSGSTPHSKQKNVAIAVTNEFQAVLDNLAVAAEVCEDSSGHHTFRVGKLSRLLTSETGADDEASLAVEHAARLHDIGKLALPGNLLAHGSTLTDNEKYAMRAHCDIGAKILAQANDERFVLAETVALSHHERWDGSGYPNNLAGEAIPLAARIVAIADAFDVLVQGRAYKAAIPVEAALAVIERAAGFHFDPGLVSLFVPMIQRLWELHGNGLNDFLCETGAQSSFLDARNSMNVLLSQL